MAETAEGNDLHLFSAFFSNRFHSKRYPQVVYRPNVKAVFVQMDSITKVTAEAVIVVFLQMDSIPIVIGLITSRPNFTIEAAPRSNVTSEAPVLL